MRKGSSEMGSFFVLLSCGSIGMITGEKRKLKYYTDDLIVHCFFFVLSILAILFFKERLQVDSSYFAFKVINSESFHVEHNRFILIFSELFAWIGVKAGLGMKSVLILYSLGHTIFFYSIFLICRYVYKDRIAGILLALIQILGITGGFFTPMFELYYCAGFVILFYTILNSKRKNLALLLFLEFFILTGHPFGYILFLFVILVHYYLHRTKYLLNYALFGVAILIIFLVQIQFASEYEQAKSGAFLFNLKSTSFNIEYFSSLFRFLFKFYLPLVLFFVVTSLIILIRRNYFLFFLINTVFILILLFVSIATGNFDPSRYQEQVYFPLSFIVAFIFAVFVLQEEQNHLVRNGLFLFISIIFIVRITSVYSAGKILEQRITTMEYLIHHCQKSGGNKFVVNEKNLEHAKNITCNWSYSIETLLLSGLTGNHKTITICTEDDYFFEGNHQRIRSDEYLFRRWEIEKLSSLNDDYFKLSESEYHFLNTQIPNDDFEDTRIIVDDLVLRKSQDNVIEIKIINAGTDTIYSGLNNEIYLGYHWPGTSLKREEYKTPVIADVHDTLIQEMVIHVPSETPGTIEIYIEQKGKKEVILEIPSGRIIFE